VIRARPDGADPCSRGGARNRGRRTASVVAVLGLVCASVVVSGAGATGAGATSNRVVTVYSVATGVQYINTEDDRVRGQVNNPLDPEVAKLAPKGSGSGKGPFAGDVAIYALSLYSSPTLKRSAGSGVYTCYFNYDQHAFCKAYFKVKGRGTLVASGPIDFGASRFTIVVTGGTDKYLGVRGELEAVAGQSNSKVAFRLIG
jgi:hypothetical protein